MSRIDGRLGTGMSERLGKLGKPGKLGRPGKLDRPGKSDKLGSTCRRARR
jgi:hypothetical protein